MSKRLPFLKIHWLRLETIIAHCGADATCITEELIMLWTILVILLILGLLGLIGGVGGGLIHLLLVVAVIVLIFNLLSGRRTVV